MSSSSLFFPDRAVVLAPYAPIRLDVTDILRNVRIEVVHADGPDHLLHIANKQSVDVAVIEGDVVDANEGLLADVRSTDPFLPVVLLSKHTISPAAWDEALKVGLVGYIGPGELTAANLVSSVQSLIHAKEQKQHAVYDVADVLDLLGEVFASREDAMRWLRSPHPELGGRRPIGFLVRGEKQVVTDLIRGALAGNLS